VARPARGETDAALEDVFYFGEDVDTYKHGRLAAHEGVWHHGAREAASA
jgi:hypothetical protein